MSAFFIFDNKAVNDPGKLEAYKTGVASVVAAYGGSYRVLGGQFEVVEGDWTPSFLVMIEFPSLDAAKKWYHSPEYAELKALRMSAVQCNGVVIEGL
jgi:uncharacterized protein (DUF1330 family)